VSFVAPSLPRYPSNVLFPCGVQSSESVSLPGFSRLSLNFASEQHPSFFPLGEYHVIDSSRLSSTHDPPSSQ
jgi:hypothetical protein